jgi:putative flippase GtrA
MAQRWFPAGELTRFLAAGLGNTIVTLVAYQVLVSAVSPAAAYTLSWAIGLLIVATLYPVAVYRVRADALLSGGTIGMVYIGGFIFGLSLTQLLVYLGLHYRFIVVVVISVTSLSNYVLGRIALSSIAKCGPSQFIRKVRSSLQLRSGRRSAKR